MERVPLMSPGDSSTVFAIYEIGGHAAFLEGHGRKPRSRAVRDTIEFLTAAIAPDVLE